LGAFFVGNLFVMHIESVLSDTSKLRALTSLDKEEFDWLCERFEPEWDSHISQFTLEGKKRKNPLLNPRKNESLPTIQHKVFFILYYLKNNSLQVTAGEQFGISQAKVSIWVNCLFELLNKTLRKARLAPMRTGEDFGKWAGQFQEHWVADIDATERPAERPVDNEAQRETYSGKKKTHTIKNNLIINLLGFVLYLSNTVDGSVHDKAICDRDPIPPQVRLILLQDSGYQGHQPENTTVIQPKKKPKGRELTPEEKMENQKISAKRVIVEHLINGVKRLRIVKEKCRIDSGFFQDCVMEIACGLHNLRNLFRGRKEVTVSGI
jgi:hypothetical protein